MEIYNFYRSWGLTLVYSNQDTFQNRAIGLLFGLGFWGILFILQGIGLYKMAKNRKMQKAWMSFVPFANVYYMGKMTGECAFFGHKMKRTGLYAMLVQIFLFALYALQIGLELSLYVQLGAPNGYTGYYVPQWYNGTGAIVNFYNDYYLFGDMIIMIADLAFKVFLVMLLTSLYRQYNPKMHMPFATLSLFIPESRYIILFAWRNKKHIDYEEYMRKRQEEFIRRQQQYQNMYGNPNNPYGNPYQRGYGPYGNPYGSPYGNPYNRNQSEEQKQESKDEPFSEFASTNSETPSSDGETKHNNNADSANDSDDFFS